MPLIWIPPAIRALTDGKDLIQIAGRTIGQALSNLDAIYPGVRNRLCQGEELRPFVVAVVDGEASGMGLHQPLREDSEVHFLPLMEGG
jgi:molybdopterin synthase sulfur carrier subunit